MPTKYTKKQEDSWNLKQLQLEIESKEGEERKLSKQHMKASQKYQVSDHVSDKNKKEELGGKLAVLQTEIANLKKNQRKLIEDIENESRKKAVQIFHPKKKKSKSAKFASRSIKHQKSSFEHGALSSNQQLKICTLGKTKRRISNLPLSIYFG